MFELFLVSAVFGLGFIIDLAISDDDDGSEPPIETTLAEDALRFDGSEANEHVTGNMLDNVVVGAEGNDLLSGLAGADSLSGGADDDRLFGGAGNDTAIGGTGDDRIFLADGDDTTEPSLQNAQDAGNDFIRGGAGEDTLIDTRGSNEVFGDLNADTLVTVDGLTADGTIDPSVQNMADTVDGGFGDDTLVGDAGDILIGGGGADHFVVVLPSLEATAPAVVTDFDDREDLFTVVFLEDAPSDNTIVFTFDTTTNLVRAAVEGQEVATLDGLEAGDIPFITTFVTTLPELMAA